MLVVAFDPMVEGNIVVGDFICEELWVIDACVHTVVVDVEDIDIFSTVGDPLGKSEFTAPKGITLMQEGLALGSMQYYSGGNFAYKKYIWINNSIEPHLQLVTAAVFASIMETAGYFETITLEE